MSVRQALVAMALVLPLTASAGEGVIGINQAAALAGGVTASDTPGFPVTLDTAGSYRLTGQLNPPLNTDGLSLQANDIDLDLNGFAIIGTAGSTTGVGVNGVTAIRASVHDGYVVDMGSHGVSLAAEARVERVHAMENGGEGIVVSHRSIVRECTSYLASLDGIDAGAGAVVEDNVVANGVSSGIRLSFARGTVRGNAVTLSSGPAITAGSHVVISGNVAFSSDEGIVCGATCQISRNAVAANSFNAVEVTDGAMIRENVIDLNGTAITGGTDSSIVRNAIRNHTAAFNLTQDNGLGFNAMSNNGNNVASSPNLATENNYCAGSIQSCIAIP